MSQLKDSVYHLCRRLRNREILDSEAILQEIAEVQQLLASLYESYRDPDSAHSSEVRRIMLEALDLYSQGLSTLSEMLEQNYVDGSRLHEVLAWTEQAETSMADAIEWARTQDAYSEGSMA